MVATTIKNAGKYEIILRIAGSSESFFILMCYIPDFYEEYICKSLYKLLYSYLIYICFWVSIYIPSVCLPVYICSGDYYN